MAKGSLSKPRSPRHYEYQTYHRAKLRCSDPTNTRYRNYGGRGIKFLFTSFDQFYAELGPRPTPQHSIDRIDNDGNYEPGNVRWATDKQQASNKSTNHRITHEGETLTTTDWSIRLGAGSSLVGNRLRRGWCETCAVTLSPRTSVVSERPPVCCPHRPERVWKKLAPSDADNIRTELARGAERDDLAQQYGVDVSVIGRIARNEVWNRLRGEE